MKEGKKGGKGMKCRKEAEKYRNILLENETNKQSNKQKNKGRKDRH